MDLVLWRQFVCSLENQPMIFAATNIQNAIAGIQTTQNREETVCLVPCVPRELPLKTRVLVCIIASLQKARLY